MKKAIVPAPSPDPGIRPPIDPQAAGQIANEVAARHVFEEFRRLKSRQTLRRHAADLALFGAFLAWAGLRPPEAAQPEPLSIDPDAWRHITWGIVQGFRDWMIQQGFAMNTVNYRLSGVRVYAQLACQAGTLPMEEWLRIENVHGFTLTQARRIDDNRQRQGISTRRETRFGWVTQSGEPIPATKKAGPARIGDEQAAQLKHLPADTPLGRRDNLLMSLLLDLGLRVGELTLLRVENIELDTGRIHFVRPKVGYLEQTHQLTPDCVHALAQVLESGDVPAIGPLVRRIERNGKSGKRALSTRGAMQRVAELGNLVGIEGLSPHDCRHYWATLASASETDPFALQEAGGWNSLAMPRRYIERQKVANQNVKLNPKNRRYQADLEALGELEEPDPSEEGEQLFPGITPLDTD